MADLAVSHFDSPYVSVYPFDTGLGTFGTKYANPATLPAFDGLGVTFSPTGTLIAVAHEDDPYISVYPWASGFGTKYADPSTPLPSTAHGVDFCTGDTDIAIAHTDSPYVSVYAWDAGFDTKYSDPATLPAFDATDVAFSPDGLSLAVSHIDSPYLSVYPWETGVGFGTKYSDPVTLPTFDATGVAFSPSGTVLVVSNVGDPYVTAYPWESGVGFGTKYADPSATATVDGNAVAFRTEDSAIALATNLSPGVVSYVWEDDYGDISSGVLPAEHEDVSLAYGVAWSPEGDYLAVAHPASPFLTVFNWTIVSGFGFAVTDPATLPSGTGTGVFWLQTAVVDIEITPDPVSLALSVFSGIVRVPAPVSLALSVFSGIVRVPVPVNLMLSVFSDISRSPDPVSLALSVFSDISRNPMPVSLALSVFWIPPAIGFAYRRDDMSFLRQGTPDQTRTIGPFISNTDFKTVQTGLSIAASDVYLIANGSVMTKNSGGATHVINGCYSLVFDEGDTDRVGELQVNILVAGSLVVGHKFVVLEQLVYDDFFADNSRGLMDIRDRLPEELIGGRLKTYRYHTKKRIP